MQFRPLHDRVLVRRIETERNPPAASSFPTRRRRSRLKARLSPLDRAAAMTRSSPLIFVSGTACCSANGRALKSRSMANHHGGV